ncbi:hypothetical protein Tco_0845140 [Tanacetum coccineum]
MCMFALTVSRTKLKNINEAMDNSTWIEVMQEELRQFDRLDVWELVDKPLCKNVINLKWLWKNKRDEEHTMIRNNAHVLGMTSCDSIGTPMATKHLDADVGGTSIDQTKYYRMVRALMYPTTSRPDIVHATSFLDSDHVGCLDSRKSTFRGIQLLGSDKLVSWSSKKQDCTSMSIAEAEYVSLSMCCTQVLWLRTQPTDYGFHFDKIPMYCDSKAAIAISYNLVQHSCTKHIDFRYHFIKEKVEKGIVELFFVRIKYQLADLFTKALSEDMFKYLVRRLGM